MLNSNGHQPKQKVVVIGLDGATLDLIRPWSEQGLLPTFNRLMKSGAWGELSVQLPPSSVPNWPSFSTGQNPGKHGVLWWVQQDENEKSERIIDRRSIKSKTVWEIASDCGKQVVVVNVPVSYPPVKVNGVMVTGLLTPPSAIDFTYPLELKDELDAVVGGYRITNQVIYRKGKEEEFLQDCLDVQRRQLQASLHLMKNRPWDLFIVVFNLTDLVVHKFWKDLDPKHPSYDKKQAEQLGTAILRAYQEADRAVEELLQAAGSDANVLIMSDHGGGGYYQAFFANNWLMEQGFLKIKKDFASQLRYRLFRLGFTMNAVYPMATALLSLMKGYRLRQNLSPRGKWSGAPRKFFLSEQDIDWERTKAYAVGDFGQIYVHPKGSRGSGNPTAERQSKLSDQEYEPLRDEIIRRLAELKVPATGKPYLKKAYKKEQLYHGPELDKLPDIIIEPNDMAYVDTGMGFVSNKLFDKTQIISGTHRLNGILFMLGPDVKPGGHSAGELNGANIIDLAPTILYLLGLPVPENMDGRVVTLPINQSRLDRQPVERMVMEAENDIGDNHRLSEEDEKVIRDHLRSLGYIA